MLTYVLKFYDNDKYVYIYYPEGNLNDRGELHFYNDGRIEIIKEPSMDVKGHYRGHACVGIKVGEEKGTVAWC